MKITSKIILSILLFFISFSLSDAEGIYVKNYKIEKTEKVLIKDSRAYVSAKDFATILGGVYSYDNKNKTATITIGKNVYEFSANVKSVKINGDKRQVSVSSILEGNTLRIPSVLLREIFEKNVSWDYNKKNLLVNSSNDKLMEIPKYTVKDVMPILEKTMGKDYNNYSFTYYTTTDVENEKYMLDGKYFVFKATEKGVIGNKIEAYFFLNVYNDYLYYYTFNAQNQKDVIKYENGEVVDYLANGKNGVVRLLARDEMIRLINESDSSLSKYTYAKKDSIDKKYIQALPKANYYYYEASKKIDGKIKPQFDLAQNTSTLDVYLFLKNEKGVNVVYLQDKKILKTISKN